MEAHSGVGASQAPDKDDSPPASTHVPTAGPGHARLDSLFRKTLFQESKKQAGLLLEELEKVVTASGLDSVLLCRRRRQLKRALQQLVANTALKKMPATH